MAHSAGFIDPLFSSGLVMTVANIEKLIDPLCRALDTDTFSRLNFAGVEEDFQRRLAFTDKLVFGAYTSFREFSLWNAWLRVWAIGLVVLESNLGSHLLMGEYSKIPLNNDPIASVYEPPGYKDFFNVAFEVIQKVHNDALSALDGSEALWEIISKYEFEIRLRSEPEFAGAEWALKASQTRDLFLGTLENHARWQKKQPDPWLTPVSN
jgi:FADH2 O2-dependent halogenase